MCSSQLAVYRLAKVSHWSIPLVLGKVWCQALRSFSSAIRRPASYPHFPNLRLSERTVETAQHHPASPLSQG